APRFPDHILLQAPPPPALYTLSLHDALPISDVARHHVRSLFHGRLLRAGRGAGLAAMQRVRHLLLAIGHGRGLGERAAMADRQRSEEHTSELQSPYDLVCRLLLEKKKHKHIT